MRELRHATNVFECGLALVCLACALGLGACGGESIVRLTLVSGGVRIPNTEVRVLVENPPGGILPRRTDAEGRIELPDALRGLRVQVGLDCDGNACRRVSPARRLEGAEMTFDVAGGLNLNEQER
jgi:hypothetical protein